MQIKETYRNIMTHSLSKVLFVVLVLLSYSGFGQEDAGEAILVLEETEHDFEDVVQGEKKQKIFSFLNEGTEPLVIDDIVTQCGCTAPEWSREPVMPGDSGEIKILYDSHGKSGIQRKVVAIVYNGPAAKIRIHANVIEE